MSEPTRTIEVKVFRFNPSVDREPHYEIHRVPFTEGSSVSTILQYINEELDGGLAHYLSCRRGICAECMIKVNGKAVLACTEVVRGDMTIDPVRQEWVVKDLLIFRPKRDEDTDG